MDFFGDYSIESASCHPSSIRVHDDRYTPTSNDSTLAQFSPGDTREPLQSRAQLTINMSALTKDFGLQSLVLEPQNDMHTAKPSLPSLRTSSSVNTPRATPCWRRRLQRERDVRLQADATHLRSIRRLVTDMVDKQDQCGVSHVSGVAALLSPLSICDADSEDDDCSDLSSPSSIRSRDSCGTRPSGFALSSAGSSARRSVDFVLPPGHKEGRVHKVRQRRNHGRV